MNDSDSDEDEDDDDEDKVAMPPPKTVRKRRRSDWEGKKKRKKKDSQATGSRKRQRTGKVSKGVVWPDVIERDSDLPPQVSESLALFEHVSILILLCCYSALLKRLYCDG